MNLQEEQGRLSTVPPCTAGASHVLLHLDQGTHAKKDKLKVEEVQSESEGQAGELSLSIPI